jgi:hypothetical protein
MAKQEHDVYGIKEDAKHGKKPNQKLKPYLVMQILQKNLVNTRTVEEKTKIYNTGIILFFRF